jgi:hypothetical protein
MCRNYFKKKLSFTLLIVFLGISNACRGQNRICTQIADVDYWKGQINGKSKDIIIRFGIGIDTLTSFTIYFNGKLLKTILCQTNYSIGYCIERNRPDEIQAIYIRYAKFKKKKENWLKILYDNNCIILKMPLNYREYNKLDISKYKSGWGVTFKRDFSQYFIE